MPKFDAKSFNEKAFGKYMTAVPNTRLNKLRGSRAITGDARLRETFKDNSQTGTVYAILPYFGLLGGEAQNYDGQTDVKTDRTKTFEQGVFTYGRMHGWTEADFSYDVTGGVDFMANVRAQLMEYWNTVDQNTILAILDGVFAMGATGTGEIKKANADFVDKHTLDVSATDHNVVEATTLNKAVQKACGDNKQRFSLVFMHSTVSTNLENLKLLTYLKYTDPQGIERDLSLGTWNGKLVVVDDSMPTVDAPATYVRTVRSAEGALEVIEDGTPTGAQVLKATVAKSIKDIAVGEYVLSLAAGTAYTSYILGDGAIGFEDLGAKVPYEMVRDAKTAGGEDTLISRKRNAVSVAGISYTKDSQVTNSPTDAELKTGANWSLVNDGTNTISHKAIPIARIISRG